MRGRFRTEKPKWPRQRPSAKYCPWANASKPPFSRRSRPFRSSSVGRNLHGNHLRHEHRVRTQFQGFLHPAFDVERTLQDDRTPHFQGRRRRQPRPGKFVHVAPGNHPAPVHRLCLPRARDIHHKLMRGPDDFMGIPLGTDGDRQHGRIAAHVSRPGNGDQVRFPSLRPAATHQNHRNRAIARFRVSRIVY